MEGRTSARPNVRYSASTPASLSCFNGGPDKCPAKRAGAMPRLPLPRRASMEGRTSARPNLYEAVDNAVMWTASMEGRTSARPNLGAGISIVLHLRASMEGRTSARPNTSAHDLFDLMINASMEGRTIARPNPQGRRSRSLTTRLQWRAGQVPGQTCVAVLEPTVQELASMEGRTSPRPNPGRTGRSPSSTSELQWRAGQVPGQTSRRNVQAQRSDALQWRAGQVPGQTALGLGIFVAPGPASMEGRTSARPNLRTPTASSMRLKPLQWRAGQVPGQTVNYRIEWVHAPMLQWRAGQVPGQTCRSGRRFRSELHGFNGGPDKCPAKPGSTRHTSRGASCFNGGPDKCPAKHDSDLAKPVQGDKASMEGRTSARPNRSSQPEGRTVPHRFNGGPDKCPAKLARPPCSERCQRIASMEGRTSARPNLSASAAIPSSRAVLQWRAGQVPGQTS